MSGEREDVRILLGSAMGTARSSVHFDDMKTGLSFSYNETLKNKTSTFLSVYPYTSFSPYIRDAQLHLLSLFLLAVISEGEGEALKQ